MSSFQYFALTSHCLSEATTPWGYSLGCGRSDPRLTLHQPPPPPPHQPPPQAQYQSQHQHQHLHLAPILQSLPTHQTALLLHSPKTPYILAPHHPLPVPHPIPPSSQGACELLVKISHIGLNPIDWKAPDYNFGIPYLPFLSGRDFVGTVVRGPEHGGGLKPGRRVREGDVVIGVSTDYRDHRKAAFQSYAVVASFNACRLPRNVSREAGACVGVAFVAAAIALGVCLGVDFRRIGGPDLLLLARDIGEQGLSLDIREECLKGVMVGERAGNGEWIVVWGSSTTGFFAAQLAKLSGLRVILVLDLQKHGARFWERGADIIVDCHDPERAVSVIRAVTGNGVRFAIDTVGKETAARLVGAFDTSSGGMAKEDGRRGHLVGLTGLPSMRSEGVIFHTVPIKLFHEVEQVGEALMTWLGTLLLEGLIETPYVEVETGGLERVNHALDRMRIGEISGRRLVVEL
ncbi:GroES-like protein [Lepidopterella palustris CBS 459.81]|uniref:GroES-like protein n=1 Tax=Lepidopterella palustris CBS 459.81 TaxID=1314670 RepID=A0A8E2E9R3_9PEZI|nr:GroES-like protein [Lepidopterella palustris CBS 459.81]